MTVLQGSDRFQTHKMVVEPAKIGKYQVGQEKIAVCGCTSQKFMVRMQSRLKSQSKSLAMMKFRGNSR